MRFHSRNVDDELNDELRFHLEMQINQNVQRGMSGENARRAALVDIGGLQQVKESCRDIRSIGWLNDLWQDLHHSFRSLAKRPGFSAIALLVFALGIGANTAIFSVLNAVLLRPLPYSDPSHLYKITCTNLANGCVFTEADLTVWRERTQVFEKISLVRSNRMFLSKVAEPEALLGLAVQRDCLSMLGTMPLIGRLFSDEDFTPASPRTVVIGYRLWLRSFGGERDILGKQITLNGDGFTVIGVMPSDFQFSSRQWEYWVPISGLASKSLGTPEVYSRAKKGTTRAQAQAEAETLSRMLFETSHNKVDRRAVAIPIQETVVASARPTLLLLSGAAVFILMIACLNVANLLYSRGAERSKEIAIRIALGAGRFRIVRQLLTESLLIAAFGGLLGLLLAGWANKLLIVLFSFKTGIPRLEQTSIDSRVLDFTVLLALMSSVAAGLIPAIEGSKVKLTECLNEAGRSAFGGIRSRRFRNLLIVCETALSLVLLVNAGLMLRSLYHLINDNRGFDGEGVITARLPLPAYKYSSGDRLTNSADIVKQVKLAYYWDILQQVKSLPGVQSAALVTALPLSVDEAKLSFDEFPNGVHFGAVSPDYFRVMGIPLIKGRTFTDKDDLNSLKVVIVNEFLASQIWPGQDPIGKRLGAVGTVAGVIANIKHQSLRAAPQPELLVPFLQSIGMSINALAVRAISNPQSMAIAIRQRIRDYQPDQPVELGTMDQLVSDSIAQPRFYTYLLAVFAGLALLLASTGIYGVVSYSVSQRQHEIGIRLALGAQHHDILREFMDRGLRDVVIGVVIGLAGALATSRLLSSLLFEVTPTDATTYILVCAFLFSWTLASMYIPARRAMRVDPLSALRCG